MMWKRLAVTSGGLGLLKPGPGTWGSLPPAILVGLLAPVSLEMTQLVLILLLIGGAIASIMLADWYATAFERQDPSEVVCDEVAGMSLCLLLLPWSQPGALGIWGLTGLAWISFRIFDIVKPEPIACVQRLPSGWGVLVDDLLAGLAAAALCWCLLLWIG
ncbi:MAG: phosphatidylglycerophosphatase A [Phycisphaerales bacterium]|nr:phosphatidylglycerophosphatase A [Phycisphaerales bacterium]